MVGQILVCAFNVPAINVKLLAEIWSFYRIGSLCLPLFIVKKLTRNSEIRMTNMKLRFFTLKNLELTFFWERVASKKIGKKWNIKHLLLLVFVSFSILILVKKKMLFFPLCFLTRGVQFVSSAGRFNFFRQTRSPSLIFIWKITSQC